MRPNYHLLRQPITISGTSKTSIDIRRFFSYPFCLVTSAVLSASALRKFAGWNMKYRRTTKGRPGFVTYTNGVVYMPPSCLLVIEHFFCDFHQSHLVVQRTLALVFSTVVSWSCRSVDYTDDACHSLVSLFWQINQDCSVCFIFSQPVHVVRNTFGREIVGG